MFTNISCTVYSTVLRKIFIRILRVRDSKIDNFSEYASIKVDVSVYQKVSIKLR